MPFRKRYKKPYEQPPPSPIEISFWEIAKPLIPELQREAWIDRKYRVDFLIPSKKVIIELYGYQHHNTKYKLTKDAERERYLQGAGYQVIRFTGTEVFKDTQKCVNEVLSLTHIEPAKIPVKSIQPVAKPINIVSKTAPPAAENNKAFVRRKKKIFGMEIWQVTVLGVMFVITMCILLFLGLMLLNLKVS